MNEYDPAEAAREAIERKRAELEELERNQKITERICIIALVIAVATVAIDIAALMLTLLGAMK